MAEQTFGQKAVGLSFNPSGDPIVQKIKEKYADITDFLHEQQSTTQSPGQIRHYAVAITEAENSQMRAVKAATWKE